jgi:hypothetical protein
MCVHIYMYIYGCTGVLITIKTIHELQMQLKLKQETLCVPLMETNFREFSETS